jgi:hypothetical protein
MLNKDFDYRGHRVTVTLIVANDVWRWWYTIDQGLPVASRDEGYGSQEDALDAAIDDAAARIDQMP